MDYVTLGKEASFEFTEKRSVFIGNAAPVKTDAEATEFIARIRKKYPDARHNTYAYVLSDGYARYSDDGEPQGTAGLPILNYIKKTGFSDACIVVTRYFGGILLGTGGLVRAYGAAAKGCAEAAGIVSFAEFSLFLVSCSYSEYQKLLPVMRALSVTEEKAEFGENVTLTLAAKEEALRAFCEKAAELGGGKIPVTVTGKTLRAQNNDEK